MVDGFFFGQPGQAAFCHPKKQPGREKVTRPAELFFLARIFTTWADRSGGA
jgi:hypothetical protein